MELLTKEIEDKLPALYSTEDIPLDKKVAVVKFFNPVGSWSWYAIEGEWQEYDLVVRQGKSYDTACTA